MKNLSDKEAEKIYNILCLEEIAKAEVAIIVVENIIYNCIPSKRKDIRIVDYFWNKGYNC